MRRGLVWALGGIGLLACSGTESSAVPIVEADGSTTIGDGDASVIDGSPGATDGGLDGDGSVGPHGPSCTVPLGLAATANAVVVGNGTAASCTEAALRTAITTANASSHVVTFACGGVKTITLSQTIDLVPGKDLTIDGGNQITIDGGAAVRLFRYEDASFQSANASTLTFQRITLANGKSTGTLLATQATGKCSHGYRNDAGGGALWARNAKVHVVEATFTGNKTAPIGPDTAGGALYVVGSVDTTVVRSRFENNEGANGGAIGSLFGGLRVYDTTFTNNRTTGFGGNGISADCPAQADGQKQVGSGGLGGAIYADGAEKHTIRLCGVKASGNHASSLGGFLIRVGYDSGQGLDIDLSTITDNVCDGKTDDNFEEGSGGAIYVQQQPVSIKRSTFARNKARAAGGALRLDFNSAVTLENVTIYGNSVEGGTRSRTDNTLGGLLGGGIFWSTNKPSTIKSCTIAENQVIGTAAGGFGGGISDTGGSFPTHVEIDDSIFANNTAPNAGVGMQCQNTATGANNVQWPRKRANGTTDDTPCVQNITFADPQLGPLAGDPPVTFPGGAVKTGASCPAEDEVGRTRATPCTLGSVEKP